MSDFFNPLSDFMFHIGRLGGEEALRVFIKALREKASVYALQPDEESKRKRKELEDLARRLS